MKSVGIIGGGIVGLSSAYFLRKAGFKVTIFDQSDLRDGCSFGNAGMIVPSHIIPLAAPGMIAQGIRWMFNSRSPFYVKPRLTGELMKWGYEFYKHANREHVMRSIPALKSISVLSKEVYRNWQSEFPFDFGYEERGLLMLYQGAHLEKEEVETAALANRAGVEAHVLSLAEIQKLEPELTVHARGGVYYPGDAHLVPGELVPKLIQLLKEAGVVIQSQTTVDGFVVENGVLKSVKTNRGEFDVDELVLAAGSWSGKLSDRLGITLPMQAGKGYSFTLSDVEKNIRIPSILLEGRVAVTPMRNDLRFGGTMEITGVDHTINMNRVKGIVETIPLFYPGLDVQLPTVDQVWHGLRPCSPDGLPYVGRSRRIRNLIYATGHAMMGLSLGPGTGKLVGEIAMGEDPSISLSVFDPERFD